MRGLDLSKRKGMRKEGKRKSVGGGGERRREQREGEIGKRREERKWRG